MLNKIAEEGLKHFIKHVAGTAVIVGAMRLADHLAHRAGEKMAGPSEQFKQKGVDTGGDLGLSLPLMSMGPEAPPAIVINNYSNCNNGNETRVEGAQPEPEEGMSMSFPLEAFFTPQPGEEE